MQRLESTVVTSPTITAEQAQMRQQEAQIIFQFAAQLTNVIPRGGLSCRRMVSRQLSASKMAM